MRSLFVDPIRPQLRWEGGNRVPPLADKVAVIAHWSQRAMTSRSFTRLVRGVVDRGYFALVVSACVDEAPLEWAETMPAETLEHIAVLRKPNIGYDFGSWAVGFLAQPHIFRASRVLQLNDSLVGPFWSLDEVIDDFESTYGDWWGMVRSFQMRPHLQSFFLGFTPPVLQSRTFQNFWREVRVEGQKDEVIQRYELGLSALLYSEGFVGTAFLEPQRAGSTDDNPMISRWSDVLRAGVPFVKRELLLRPDTVPDGENMPERLRREWGIEVADWM